MIIKDEKNMNQTKKKDKKYRAPGRSLALLLSLLLICALFCFGASAADDYKDLKLIPGGIPFGVKFNTEGVIVVGFCDLEGLQKSQNPAYLAGLRPKDVITEINGLPVKDASSLTRAVEESGGRELSLTYLRGGQKNTIKLTPLYSETDGSYKTGIWVRDSGAGIGTVTYILPQTGSFGGLGHGICDGETGELIKMDSGVVTDVKISAVKKGIAGTPGEIKGYFGTEKTGTLLGNTDCGVYGLFSQIPASVGKAIPIGTRHEVKEGAATILSTLENGQRQEYKIEIGTINRDAKGSKCFIINIKDPALIEKSGGIVQGMSGSPILQNGKLIGAVTHVMINDPCTGYGIFIENMLDNMPAELR